MAQPQERVKVTYTTTDTHALDSFHGDFDQALATVDAAFGQSYPNLAGNEELWTDEQIDDRSPCDARLLLARFPRGTAAHVDTAVAAAAKAFPVWSRTPYRERLAVLRAAADLMVERGMEWAAWITLEVGKNRIESLAEVEESADLIRYYCDEMERHDGLTSSGVVGTDEYVTNTMRPYGVFAVISPFNFPLALGTGMSAGALVTGNTVVWKPASDCPLSGYLLHRALTDAGVPEGTFNIVVGPGAVVGNALVDHPQVAGIAFTGSRDVGIDIFARAARGRSARPCITEMGGKNPVIVMPSADLDAAAEGTMRSAFAFGGQRCSAASRVLVHDSVHEAFVDALVAKTRELVVGDPRRRDVYLGPLISNGAVSDYERYVAQARADGDIAYGGNVLREGPLGEGFYVEPTIVTGLPKGHPLLIDELFVPIVCVLPLSSFDEALEVANDVDYGLCAGIFSQEDAEIERFFDEIEAGVTFANRRVGATTGAWPGVQSFGGWKYSGSTGKNALGPWYLPQFVREQSQTRVGL